MIREESMRYIVREPLALLAGTLVILTLALVAFSLISDLPESNIVVGLVIFSLLPLLAVAGAVVFYLAVHSDGFRGE